MVIKDKKKLEGWENNRLQYSRTFALVFQQMRAVFKQKVWSEYIYTQSGTGKTRCGMHILPT